MLPRLIRLFLVDGRPAGLRTAEIGLSTCKAVACPRASLGELRKRPEAQRTGVYVLTGESESGRPAVYVGEGDAVITRLARHDSQRDFWNHVVLFVSKDENLTKAHVRYLEARMIALARQANRADVVNSTFPEAGRLPEADIVEMEQFLDQVRLLLGIFGISAFEPAPASTGDRRAFADLDACFHIAKQDISARGMPTDNGFVVFQGSKARLEELSSLDVYNQAVRRELQDSGVLVERDGALVFTQDYEFTSPSRAAQVVVATSANGRIAWKLADGTTLKETQDRALDAVVDGDDDDGDGDLAAGLVPQ